MTAASLCALAGLLAAGNVWYALARTLIPLSLDAQVRGKEVRHEKHPPKDDVHLLDLGPAGKLQVNPAVFERVTTGDSLRKDAWSARLYVNDQAVLLEWSAEARGMLAAMPLSLVVLLGTTAVVSGRVAVGRRSRTTAA
jgi:hypothetical protein